MHEKLYQQSRSMKGNLHMKKLLALVLVLGVMAGVSFGEAWNLDERIHPDLKESFANYPEMNITAETLPEIQKSLSKILEALPKDDAVEVYDEMITSTLRVRVYKPKSEQKDFPGLAYYGNT